MPEQANSSLIYYIPIGFRRERALHNDAHHPIGHFAARAMTQTVGSNATKYEAPGESGP